MLVVRFYPSQVYVTTHQLGHSHGLFSEDKVVQIASGRIFAQIAQCGEGERGEASEASQGERLRRGKAGDARCEASIEARRARRCEACEHFRADGGRVEVKASEAMRVRARRCENPYLILRVTGFDFASGPIPVNGKHCRLGRLGRGVSPCSPRRASSCARGRPPLHYPLREGELTLAVEPPSILR